MVAKPRHRQKFMSKVRYLEVMIASTPSVIRKTHSMMHHRLTRLTPFAVCQALIFAMLSGCSDKPGRIQQADVDFKLVSEQLFEAYDQDGSQSLDLAEAQKLSAIGVRFNEYDSNADKAITRDEIEERLQTTVFDPRKAFMEVSCVIKNNSRILPGATVKFVPVSFLETWLPPARGESDNRGVVKPSIEAKDFPENAPKLSGFMRPGIYRVEITHPSVQIPAKYNSESILTVEVSSSALATGSLMLQINSH